MMEILLTHVHHVVIYLLAELCVAHSVIDKTVKIALERALFV